MTVGDTRRGSCRRRDSAVLAAPCSSRSSRWLVPWQAWHARSSQTLVLLPLVPGLEPCAAAGAEASPPAPPVARDAHRKGLWN